MTPASRPGRGGAFTLAVVLLGAVALLALGALVGSAATNDADGTGAASPNAVDVGFSRDMRDHHAQAVEMSVLVRDATGDPQIRMLALDIMLTQQQQLGQMYGWLSSWGETQANSEAPTGWMGTASEAAPSGEGMAGMDHGTQTAPADESRMPGMASEQDLRKLRAASGVAAERLYLQLMIPHHEAGVSMAEYATEHASQSHVRQLAQSIVDSQTSELEVLRSLLAARGGNPPQ